MKKVILAALAIAGLMTTTAFAHNYDQSQVLFEEEFTGTSLTSWNVKNAEKKLFYTSSGWAVLDNTSKTVTKTLKKTVDLDLSSVTELTYEMKFKVETVAGNSTYNAPVFYFGSSSLNRPVMQGGWVAVNTAGEGQTPVYEPRYLCYGTSDSQNGHVGSGLTLGETYTATIVRDNVANTMSCVIVDSEGVTHGTKSFNISTDISNFDKEVSEIQFGIPAGWKISVDYMVIASTGLNLNSITPSATKDVRTDAEFAATFSSEITDDSMVGITLADGDGNEVPVTVTKDSKDKKTLNISLPIGLEYSTKYELTIPGTLADNSGKKYGGKTVKFTTEDAPFAVTSAKATVGADVTATVAYKNNSGLDKEVTVLVLVYEDGVLKDMKCEKVTLDTASTSKTVTLTPAAAYTGTTTAEVFVMDSLAGLQNLV